jgi:MraZ protein
MTGQYQHSVDAKGRLFIPVKLREELGDTFYVTISMTDPCLTAYSEEGWEKLTQKFESLPFSQARTAIRLLYANAAKCEPDAQGRILLPQKLRDYADLKKEVVVAGLATRAEIWNAEKWTAQESEELASGDLRSIAEQLGM